MGHPAVAEAAVIAVRTPGGASARSPSSVLKPGQHATAGDLRDVPRAAVREMVASGRLRIRRRDSRTSAGKFLKSALRERYRDAI